MAKMTRRMFLLGGLAIFPYLYLERFTVALRRYRVPVRSLPPSFEGFTLLHLPDLHDKEFGRGGTDLLRMLKGEKFDLVALTGDLVVGKAPTLGPALDLVAGLKKISDRPVCSVSGNHEWQLGYTPEFNRRLREAGVQVLDNGNLAIERGKDRIWLMGVDDPVTGRDRLEMALAKTERDRPRLLLAHSPHPYPLAIEQGVDLMLAGHTHGGQVRLPLLGAAFVPGMGFFPRWDYGFYRSGRTSMIVSCGLGESLLPIRINMRPEVSLVTLVGRPG